MVGSQQRYTILDIWKSLSYLEFTTVKTDSKSDIIFVGCMKSIPHTIFVDSFFYFKCNNCHMTTACIHVKKGPFLQNIYLHYMVSTFYIGCYANRQKQTQDLVVVCPL